MKSLCLYTFVIFCLSPIGIVDGDDTVFHVVIQRLATKDGLTTGKLFVNTDPLNFTDGLQGETYENSKLSIPTGSYNGSIRYWSGHNFVTGPFGSIGQTGDFLLEVGSVESPDGPRTNILFHGGDKAEQSAGCILLGAVGKNPLTGTPVIDDNHPLRKIRLLFYGTDDPSSTPSRRIVVDVLE